MHQHQRIIKKNNWDRFGFFLSILCAIHCASVPFLIAVLPLLGSELLHNTVLELILVSTTIIIAGVIIVKDYFQTHKNLLPFFLLVLGLSTKLLGIFVFHHHYESTIIIFGAAFIILAYISNWRLRVSHQAACKC